MYHHLKQKHKRLGSPCWPVAWVAGPCSCLSCRWEMIARAVHCSYWRIAVASSHHTWTKSHVMERGEWSGLGERDRTGWSWSWDLACYYRALSVCCKPAFAAIRTTATRYRRAWSDDLPKRAPEPVRTMMVTCCRCYPAVPCYSWAYCGTHRHIEAYMEHDGLAYFLALSGMMWCCEKERK